MQAVPDETSGGCNIRLVTPAACAEVDLTNGKSYEVAWTTDGTGCETPWTIFILGNPPSETNGGSRELPTNGGTITQKGGIVNLIASDLDGITSDNGLYHWTIKSFYGSHPASVAFRVKK